MQDLMTILILSNMLEGKTIVETAYLFGCNEKLTVCAIYELP